MKIKKISFKSTALLLVAGLIALNLIGLKLYKNEIDDYLKNKISKEGIGLDSLSRFTQEEINQKFDIKLGKSINDYFTSKQSHEDQIDELKLELDVSFRIKEKAYIDYKCECDGTCGSGKVGRGSECERKEQKYLQSDRKYKEIKAQVDSIQNNTEILTIEKKIQKDIKVFNENKIESSYLERVKTLWHLIF